MQTATLENTFSNEESSKTKQSRVKRAMWRYREDGTYDYRPLAETYFNDYYHEKLAVKVQCPHCKKLVTKQTLGRHINTAKKCLAQQNQQL